MLSRDSWLNVLPRDVIPGLGELAALCSHNLPERPTKDDVQALFDIWGNNKVFGANAPAVAAALNLDGETVPDDRVLDLLEGTGTLSRIPLRTVHGESEPTGPVTAIITSGTAGWIKRRVTELALQNDTGLYIDQIFVLTSDRPCDTPTEVIHPAVLAYGRVPTESELIQQSLANQGFTADAIYSSGTLDDQLGRMHWEQGSSMSNREIYVPGNANATYVPLTVREFFANKFPRFDTPGNLRVWFSQDEFPLARTPEQAADTQCYQRPLTVFPGLVRLVKMLVELNR